MSNIIASVGNNVVFPTVQTLPETLEEGTFVIYNNVVYVGNSSDEPVIAVDIASVVNAATAKTTPVDNDLVGLVDSAASNVLKKLTWANLKATLGSVFFNKSSDDSDDITEGSTNLFLSAISIENLAAGNIENGLEFPARDGDDDLVKATLSDLATASFFTSAYQPISVTDTVPANGALPNGKQILVVNSAVGRELYVGDASNNPVPACGYRQYVATLTQTGTNAPVATVIKNTLGGTLVWGYTSAGTYTATLSDAFTESKTLGIQQIILDAGDQITAVSSSRVSNNVVQLLTIETTTVTNINDALTDFPFEIRVYA